MIKQHDGFYSLLFKFEKFQIKILMNENPNVWVSEWEREGIKTQILFKWQKRIECVFMAYNK